MAAAFLLVTSAAAQPYAIREIMAEPSVAGQRPDGEKLSPDGSKVIFLWSADGKPQRDLYIVPAAGGTPTILLRYADLPPRPPRPEKENKLDYGVELRDNFVRSRENNLGGFEWSPDSKKLLFSHGGDLYVMTLEPRSIKRFTRTQGSEGGARFIDGDRISFSQSGHTYVLNTADATIAQITRETNPQSSISAGNVTLNKAGTRAAYVVTDSSKLKSLVVPNYLPEFVVANPTRRGWSDQKLYVVNADGSSDEPAEIKLPKPEGVGGFRRMSWAADGTSLIVDRGDKDTKRRRLFYVKNAGQKDEKIVPVTEETDDKWLAPLSGMVEAHPTDASTLYFTSERDGYNHIYLARLEGDAFKTTQLTRGNWQVEWAKWEPGAGGRIIYMSTERGTADRTFSAVDLNGNTLQLFKSDTDPKYRGMLDGPQLASDPVGPDIRILFGRSKWNEPGELFTQSFCVGCGAGQNQSEPVKLTNSVPAAFASRKWIEPKFIDIPSRDGKVIKAKIYLPPGHRTNSKTKYPMAIFVHGAGYLQNTTNGWSGYYREFMFNEMLASRGYVVLDLDYRGSAGYGRDWRTDVHDFLGGKDYEDHLDGIDHMVKNYAVDPAKVGAYGGSYGGFMSAMLVLRAPDKIAAAAALRPVFDWKNYYASSPSYTLQRLGFPDKNPEAYRRSSPIFYADKLEKPLLILHGMSDDNVPVQDSVQMIEKLVRLNKSEYFDAMLYPSENHGFVRPESWSDEYQRIFNWFEKYLNASSIEATSNRRR